MSKFGAYVSYAKLREQVKKDLDREDPIDWPDIVNYAMESFNKYMAASIERTIMSSGKVNCEKCDSQATWVDNIPGKEYYYCRDCKLEVNPNAGLGTSCKHSWYKTPSAKMGGFSEFCSYCGEEKAEFDWMSIDKSTGPGTVPLVNAFAAPTKPLQPRALTCTACNQIKLDIDTGGYASFPHAKYVECNTCSMRHPIIPAVSATPPGHCCPNRILTQRVTAGQFNTTRQIVCANCGAPAAAPPAPQTPSKRCPSSAKGPHGEHDAGTMSDNCWDCCVYMSSMGKSASCTGCERTKNKTCTVRIGAPCGMQIRCPDCGTVHPC